MIALATITRLSCGRSTDPDEARDIAIVLAAEEEQAARDAERAAARAWDASAQRGLFNPYRAVALGPASAVVRALGAVMAETMRIRRAR